MPYTTVFSFDMVIWSLDLYHKIFTVKKKTNPKPEDKHILITNLCPGLNLFEHVEM